MEHQPHAFPPGIQQGLLYNFQPLNPINAIDNVRQPVAADTHYQLLPASGICRPLPIMNPIPAIETVRNQNTAKITNLEKQLNQAKEVNARQEIMINTLRHQGELNSWLRIQLNEKNALLKRKHGEIMQLEQVSRNKSIEYKKLKEQLDDKKLELNSLGNGLGSNIVGEEDHGNLKKTHEGARNDSTMEAIESRAQANETLYTLKKELKTITKKCEELAQEVTAKNEKISELKFILEGDSIAIEDLKRYVGQIEQAHAQKMKEMKKQIDEREQAIASEKGRGVLLETKVIEQKQALVAVTAELGETRKRLKRHAEVLQSAGRACNRCQGNFGDECRKRRRTDSGNGGAPGPSSSAC